MKKILAILLLSVLLLTACGSKPVYGVSTNEDNSISVTAEKGPKGSGGIGYLTVEEGDTVAAACKFNEGGKIQLRFFAGLLGSEDFPDEPAVELEVSGQDTARITIDPGEYTVAILAESTVSGTAEVYIEKP